MSNSDDKIELSEAISLETVTNTVLYPTDAVRNGKVTPKIVDRGESVTVSSLSKSEPVLFSSKPVTTKSVPPINPIKEKKDDIEVQNNLSPEDDNLPFHQATHEHIQDWFFRVGEEFFGPFSKTEIKQGIISGELSIHTYVSNRIEGPYATLERHPDFNDIFKELERKKLYKRTG